MRPQNQEVLIADVVQEVVDVSYEEDVQAHCHCHRHHGAQVFHEKSLNAVEDHHPRLDLDPDLGLGLPQVQFCLHQNTGLKR